MKTKKRILSAILALAMIFTAVVPVLASAAEPTTPPTSTDMVIHKIEMPDLTGWPKGGGTDKYDGSPLVITEYFGANAKPLAGVTFTYYVVTDEQLAAMKLTPGDYDTVAKMTEKFPGLTGTTTDPTTAAGVTVTLNHGTTPQNYWFVENMGSDLGDGRTLSQAAAVPFGITLPMIKADGTYFTNGDNALNVYPKNTVADKPEVDKDFEGKANPTDPRDDKATPESYTVGDDVPYEILTNIPANVQWKTARWSDQMTEGLTFNLASLKVFNGTTELVRGTDYTVVEDEPNGFEVTLSDAYLANTINGKPAQQIKITYTATLNEKAVVAIPESNDVTFNYGNNPDHGNTPIPTKPLNETIKVSKQWVDANGATIAPPTGVTVTVQLVNAQTGAPEGAAVELNAENGWTHTWSGLDADTEYKVVETAISGYSAEYILDSQGIVTVKNWKDDNPKPIEPTEPKVVTGGKKFIKVDGINPETVLANARFVVINKNAGDDINKYLALKSTEQQQTETDNYNAAEAAYQAYVDATNTTNIDQVDTTLTPQITRRARLAELLAERNAAYDAMNNEYVWTNVIGDAIEFTSGTDGIFHVTGLAYGDYALKETVAPTGYALLPGEIPFTVGANTYDTTTPAGLTGHTANNEQIVENNKVTIPQTGGIGTVIFIVAGLLIMGTALVVMKKRQELDV